VVWADGGNRGDPLGQDRRMPRGLPFLFAVVTLRVPCWPPVPRHRRGAGRGPGDRRLGRHRVLHRAGHTGARRADHAADLGLVPWFRRRPASTCGVGRDPGGRPSAAPGGRRCAPLQPQSGDGPLLFRPDRHHAYLDERWGPAGRSKRRDGAVLRCAAGMGRATSSASSSSESWPISIPPKSAQLPRPRPALRWPSGGPCDPWRRCVDRLVPPRSAGGHPALRRRSRADAGELQAMA